MQATMQATVFKSVRGSAPVSGAECSCQLSSQGKSLSGGRGVTCGTGFVECLICCFEDGSQQLLDQDHRLVVSFYVPSPAIFWQ